MSRKPMNFALDEPTKELSQQTRVPTGKASKATADSKKTVGARVTTSIYRQLKSHAALSGATVQDLVEEAIREKLDRIAKRSQAA